MQSGNRVHTVNFLELDSRPVYLNSSHMLNANRSSDKKKRRVQDTHQWVVFIPGLLSRSSAAMASVSKVPLHSFCQAETIFALGFMRASSPAGNELGEQVSLWVNFQACFWQSFDCVSLSSSPGGRKGMDTYAVRHSSNDEEDP